MTQVDFYILEDASRGNQLQFAARLTEQLFRSGHRVHLHTDTAEKVREIDELLWSTRDTSFIPHQQSNQPLPDCPVTIGTETFAGSDEVLLNLADLSPDYFSHFKRVIEIIDKQADDVEKGRTRYKFYKERGYPLKTHNIR